MTEEERNQLLLEIREDLKKKDKMFAEMKAEMKADRQERDKSFAELREDNQKRDELYADIRSKLELIQGEVGALRHNFNRLEKKVDNMSDKMALMQQKFDDKIEILFDLVEEPYQNFNNVKEKVESHNDRLYEHDVRIQVLESKAVNS